MGIHVKEIKGETVRVRYLQALRPGGRPLMATKTETYVSRLKQRYEDEIRPALKDELELDSIMRSRR